MKRLYRACDLADDTNPAAVILVLFIFPVAFALMVAYMAGWL